MALSFAAMTNAATTKVNGGSCENPGFGEESAFWLRPDRRKIQVYPDDAAPMAS
ncbi:hypothetical protein [Halomonas shantousis]